MPPPAQERWRSQQTSMAVPKIMPLSDDEVQFCWRGLVDEGRLSVHKLRKFMEDVCGFTMSTMQAKDLLAYMDANGDGRVGMEDFKYFMGTPSLEHLDAKTFMWNPKAKYREEHAVQEEEHGDTKEVDRLVSTSAGATATASLFKTQRRNSNLELFQTEVPAPMQSPVAEASETPRATTIESTPETPRATTASSSRRARTQERATDSKKAPPNVESSQAKDEVSAAPAPSKAYQKPDAKALAKIEQSLAKYEADAWDKLLKFESDFKRQLFSQFAGDADHLTIEAYHKMLMKWFPLAQWSAAGPLRCGDSLAAMAYCLQREKQHGCGAGGSQPTDAGGQSGSGSGAADVDMANAKISFQVFQDIMGGKYQPTEHITVAGR